MVSYRITVTNSILRFSKIVKGMPSRATVNTFLFELDETAMWKAALESKFFAPYNCSYYCTYYYNGNELVGHMKLERLDYETNP